MDYNPTAVAVGYLREPDMLLPMPGPDFAAHVRTLLNAAAHRPDTPDSLPAGPDASERSPHETSPRPVSSPGSQDSTPAIQPQRGETAHR